MRILAMILAGRANDQLGALTAVRAEAAVPFAGKYRIIDFALSNCVNSQIFNVCVLTQYLPRSLNEHIGVGKPWELDRAHGGVRIFQPYLGPNRRDWERGSADAVQRHLDFIDEQRVDTILVLGGSHIYMMDYRPLLQFHQQCDADVTLGIRHVDPAEAHRFGIVSTDANQRVTDFREKPQDASATTASMGVYVFKTNALKQHFQTHPDHVNFGADILPVLVPEKRVFAYKYEGYWADVSTVHAYWSANMAMISDTPALNLHDPNWIIHTRSEERPPAKIGAAARVSGNLIANGAIVNGVIERSVISPGVYIAEGATVTDSVIMNNCQIGSGAVIRQAVLDKNVVVDEYAEIQPMQNTINQIGRNKAGTSATDLCVIEKGRHVTRSA